MIEITEEERKRAIERSHRKYLTDMISNFVTEWDNGVRIGLEESLRETLGENLWKRIEEGDRVLQMTIAQGYLDSDIPFYIIADVLGLPGEEMYRLCAEKGVVQKEHSLRRDIVIARNLIKCGFSQEQIMEALDLPLEELERLRAEN